MGFAEDDEMVSARYETYLKTWEASQPPAFRPRSPSPAPSAVTARSRVSGTPLLIRQSSRVGSWAERLPSSFSSAPPSEVAPSEAGNATPLDDNAAAQEEPEKRKAKGEKPIAMDKIKISLIVEPYRGVIESNLFKYDLDRLVFLQEPFLAATVSDANSLGPLLSDLWEKHCKRASVTASLTDDSLVCENARRLVSNSSVSYRGIAS